MRTITTKEVNLHNTRDNIWIIIKNKVYDVTNFLKDHPGGVDILLVQAGQDGSDAFEDVGHSADAKDLMKTFLIGELPESERIAEKQEKKDVRQKVKTSNKNFYDEDTTLSLTWTQWLITGIVSASTSLIVRSILNAI